MAKMGLATRQLPGSGWWRLKPSAIFGEPCMRADIIKPCTGPSPERGQDRGVADYVIDGEPGSTIIGRRVDKGPSHVS